MMKYIGKIYWCIQKTAEKIVDEICQAHCHSQHLHRRRGRRQGPEDSVPVLDRERGKTEGDGDMDERNGAVAKIVGALGQKNADEEEDGTPSADTEADDLQARVKLHGTESIHDDGGRQVRTLAHIICLSILKLSLSTLPSMAPPPIILHNMLVFLALILFAASVNGRPALHNSRATTNSSSSGFFHVLEYGAKGDGETDDTEAFLVAWEAACKTWPGAILLVPKEMRFVVSPVSFEGPCYGATSMQVDGIIMAPRNPEAWDRHQLFWMEFKNIDCLTINGTGTINGRGENWWFCELYEFKGCPSRPPPSMLRIFNSTNVNVDTLALIQSQKMHLVFENCLGVHVTNLRIDSPIDSPNTHGIHVQKSMDVLIQSCIIASGDDCISIGNGAFNVFIQDIKCGPGYGIGIGSLGEKHGELQVSNILVDGAILDATRYGVRIRIWQGDSGFARLIKFQNIKMHEVGKPVLIDQHHCIEADEPCFYEESAVEISAVMYRNITGTSKTREAIVFACSKTTPCNHIVLEDIDLAHASKGEVQARCDSASGLAFGKVHPPSCLNLQT